MEERTPATPPKREDPALSHSVKATTQALLDPAALEARLEVARAQRAEALARKAQAKGGRAAKQRQVPDRAELPPESLVPLVPPDPGLRSEPAKPQGSPPEPPGLEALQTRIPSRERRSAAEAAPIEPPGMADALPAWTGHRPPVQPSPPPARPPLVADGRVTKRRTARRIPVLPVATLGAGFAIGLGVAFLGAHLQRDPGTVLEASLAFEGGNRTGAVEGGGTTAEGQANPDAGSSARIGLDAGAAPPQGAPIQPEASSNSGLATSPETVADIAALEAATVASVPAPSVAQERSSVTPFGEAADGEAGEAPEMDAVLSATGSLVETPRSSSAEAEAPNDPASVPSSWPTTGDVPMVRRVDGEPGPAMKAAPAAAPDAINALPEVPTGETATAEVQDPVPTGMDARTTEAVAVGTASAMANRASGAPETGPTGAADTSPEARTASQPRRAEPPVDPDVAPRLDEPPIGAAAAPRAPGAPQRRLSGTETASVGSPFPDSSSAMDAPGTPSAAEAPSLGNLARPESTRPGPAGAPRPSALSEPGAGTGSPVERLRASLGDAASTQASPREEQPPPAEPLDVSAAVGARIFIHYPPDAQAEADALAAEMEGADLTAVTRPAGVSISESNVRFFHDADREAAREVSKMLAEHLGGGLPPARDFTSFRPQPEPGLVEVWLAGSAPSPAVRQASTNGAAAERRQAVREAERREAERERLIRALEERLRAQLRGN